jgi:hypothetical protein
MAVARLSGRAARGSAGPGWSFPGRMAGFLLVRRDAALPGERADDVLVALIAARHRVNSGRLLFQQALILVFYVIDCGELPWRADDGTWS